MKLIIFSAFLAAVVNLASTNEKNPCKDPGVIADEKDCTKFHVCAGSPGNATVASKVKCPPGSVFSTEDKTCVDSYRKPECQVKTRVRRQEPPFMGYCNSMGPHCENCDRFVVCANLQNRSIVVTELYCSKDNRICKNNACNDPSPGDQCTVPAPFRCLAPGIYPDVADCKRYHVCTNSLQHFTDVCDQYYDACNTSCTDLPAPPAGGTTACQTTATPFACNKDATISYFVQCPQYYSLCIPRRDPLTSTIIYETSVMRCPNTYVFDSSTRTCRVSCGNKRTRIPVPDDCHDFLDCTGENKAPERVSCAPGTAFDAVRRMCLPEAQVAACQKVTITPTPTPTITPKPTEGAPCQVGQRMPHPNVNRYYECRLNSMGRPEMLVLQCPFPMCFNRVRKECRYLSCIWG